MTRATFAACDEPVDAGEIDLIERAQKGFGANEPNGRWDGTEVVDSPSVTVCLN